MNKTSLSIVFFAFGFFFTTWGFTINSNDRYLPGLLVSVGTILFISSYDVLNRPGVGVDERWKKVMKK